MTAPLYQRLLLKLSGEALQGAQGSGIDPTILQRVAQEVAAVAKKGVQVGIVIGGGNYCRGATLETVGVHRVTGDRMGMLATVINSIALADALNNAGASARVLSAVAIPKVCEDFSREAALRALDGGEVVVFAAGTGNPFFTTDTAACLRGIEIGADVVCKATMVDGVYDADPKKNPNAKRFEELTLDEVLERKLGVMDLTAILLCREHQMPLRVFDMTTPGNLTRIVEDLDTGTRVNPA